MLAAAAAGGNVSGFRRFRGRFPTGGAGRGAGGFAVACGVLWRALPLAPAGLEQDPASPAPFSPEGTCLSPQAAAPPSSFGGT